MSDPVHDELLLEAMAGDRESLHVLLTLLYPTLTKAVARVWFAPEHSTDSVEDIVQETITSAWESFGSFQTPAYAAFKAWVIAIANNHIRNAVRSLKTQKRQHTRHDIGEDGLPLVEFFARHTKSPRSFLANKEQVELLLATINALPDLQRDIFRWRLIDGESFQTIVERVGKSESAVKMQFHRALRLVRTVMDGFHNPPEPE